MHQIVIITIVKIMLINGGNKVNRLTFMLGKLPNQDNLHLGKANRLKRDINKRTFVSDL